MAKIRHFYENSSNGYIVLLVNKLYQNYNDEIVIYGD